jgi:hypothetical protein
MFPLSLTEANLRAAFWRAIEGISADQICTTSRDDSAFSMNLRRESRFEREMESKARRKGAKAEVSLKASRSSGEKPEALKKGRSHRCSFG